MKLQLLSDLHIEFKQWEYQPCEADVVILAGDIDVKGRGVDWVLNNIKNVPVLYVFGNHEFYGKAYPKLIEAAKAKVANTNVRILEKDLWRINGINFLGCTFWTDFKLFGNPRAAGYHCQEIMNDYKKIRRSPSFAKMRASDTAAIHADSRKWLSDSLKTLNGQRNVVITHHGPSRQSAPENLPDDLIMAAYVSNLKSFIKEHHPSYWLHGHLHNSAAYRVGSCEVVCNPKGYPDEENSAFNPTMCIEI